MTIRRYAPLVFVSCLAAGNTAAMDWQESEFLISTEPLMLLGGINIEGSMKVHEQFSLGLFYARYELSLIDWLLDDFDPDLVNYGLRADWQPFGVFETGVYVAGIAGYSGLDVVYTDPDSKKTYEGGVGGMRLTALGGVQWGGETFFNRMGGGMYFQSLDDVTIPLDDEETITFPWLDAFAIPLPVIPTIEWTFGVKF